MPTLPLTYRELWLPQHINGTQIGKRNGLGHVQTITGGLKRTTTDGVHFTGAATSNIVVAANAAQNAKAAFNVTIRFKLDQTFAAGAAGNFYLLNKVSAATYIRVYLKAADGKLYWEQDNGVGGAGFSLTSTTVSWTAGTWYIVTCSMTDTPTQRLLVNGAAEDTDISAAVTTPNGGDIIIGSSSDGGTDGIVGVISKVIIGVGATATVALTAAEETSIANGFVPATAKVQHYFTMDEGRGLTATDRGSVGVNGTLDSACTWLFGQVKAPTLSLDGLNDQSLSPTGVDMGGNFTVVWIGRMSVPKAANPSGNGFLWLLQDLVPNYVYVDTNGVSSNTFHVKIVNNAVTTELTYSPTTMVIGEYKVLIFTRVAGGAIVLYDAGTSAASGTNAGYIPPQAAIAYIGSDTGPGQRSNDSLIKLEIIEGAMTAAQVKIHTRHLRDIYNLPGTFA